MDYSKVKFVKSPTYGYDLTPGRVYKYTHLFANSGMIVDDAGDTISIRIPGCANLQGSHWIPCDENGKEVDNGV